MMDASRALVEKACGHFGVKLELRGHVENIGEFAGCGFMNSRDVSCEISAIMDEIYRYCCLLNAGIWDIITLCC